MNQNERNELLAYMSALSAYYRNPLPDMVLKMYADDLNDLPFDEIIKAYDRHRKDPKSRAMPLPAQIRGSLRPNLEPESAAREIISRILEAQDKFGYTWPSEAKEFIGEIGWSLIRAYGGWETFCQSLGVHFSIDSFSAQGREILKGRIIHGSTIGEIAKSLPYRAHGDAYEIPHGKAMELVSSLVDNSKDIKKL